MEHEHQIPIWFFIGVLLALYGVLICGAGIYGWTFPPPKDQRVVLWDYHADLWWGLLMMLVGALYTIKFHPFREQLEEANPRRTAPQPEEISARS